MTSLTAVVMPWITAPGFHSFEPVGGVADEPFGLGRSGMVNGFVNCPLPGVIWLLLIVNDCVPALVIGFGFGSTTELLAGGAEFGATNVDTVDGPVVNGDTGASVVPPTSLTKACMPWHHRSDVVRAGARHDQRRRGQRDGRVIALRVRQIKHNTAPREKGNGKLPEFAVRLHDKTPVGLGQRHSSDR